MTELKAEIEKGEMIVGDINISLSVIDGKGDKNNLREGKAILSLE